MNRRDFFKLVPCLPYLIKAIPPTRYIIGVDWGYESLSLAGVPYHLSDATAGTWLGFQRVEAYPELIELVKKLESTRRS